MYQRAKQLLLQCRRGYSIRLDSALMNRLTLNVSVLDPIHGAVFGRGKGGGPSPIKFLLF